MIYTVTLNPALDKTAQISGMELDKVNRVGSLRTDAGGKGLNVSKAVKSLNGDTCAFTVLGGKCGETIEEQLKGLGIRTEVVWVESETRTNLVIVDPQNHTTTDINEPGGYVPPEKLAQLLQRLLSRLQPGDITVLAGSIPQGADSGIYREWAEACRAQGAKVFLDADGDNLKQGLKAVPYFIKPNKFELGKLVGRELTDMNDICREADKLLQTGIAVVVVSLGGDGALFLTEKEKLRAKGLSVPVRSTVGAGDTMVAGMAFGIQNGAPLEETARLAVAASGAKVMNAGTQAPDAAEITRLLPQVELVKL